MENTPMENTPMGNTPIEERRSTRLAAKAPVSYKQTRAYTKRAVKDQAMKIAEQEQAQGNSEPMNQLQNFNNAVDAAADDDDALAMLCGQFGSLCKVGSSSNSASMEEGGRKRRRHGKKTHKKHHKKHHKKTHKRRH